jgi:hypothetical protein
LKFVTIDYTFILTFLSISTFTIHSQNKHKREFYFILWLYESVLFSKPRGKKCFSPFAEWRYLFISLEETLQHDFEKIKRMKNIFRLNFSSGWTWNIYLSKLQFSRIFYDDSRWHFQSCDEFLIDWAEMENLKMKNKFLMASRMMENAILVYCFFWCLEKFRWNKLENRVVECLKMSF